MTPIDEIAAERKRQIEKEGWDHAHDNEHTGGELALAAACYAYFSTFDPRPRDGSMDNKEGFVSILRYIWPRSWAWYHWKPKSRRRDLVRAGALIVAELERLDRADKEESA